MSMKRMFALICGFMVLAATVQQAAAQDALESEFDSRLSKAISLSLEEVRPNEVTSAGLSFSGIIVAAFKTDNLLQLVNPFAPSRYGSAEDNSLRDFQTSKLSGWKLFSIRF
jgi:hypothetical protein